MKSTDDHNNRDLNPTPNSVRRYLYSFVFPAALAVAATISLGNIGASADYRELHILDARIDPTRSVADTYAELHTLANKACRQVVQPGRDQARDVRICRKEVLTDWVDRSGLDRLVSYHLEQTQPQDSRILIAAEK